MNSQAPSKELVRRYAEHLKASGFLRFAKHEGARLEHFTDWLRASGESGPVIPNASGYGLLDWLDADTKKKPASEPEQLTYKGHPVEYSVLEPESVYSQAYADQMRTALLQLMPWAAANSTPEQIITKALLPPDASSQPPLPAPLRINGAQVLSLVDFMDLSGTPEAKETPMCLRHYAEDRMEPGEHGEPMPAGLYAWFEEYPEEGQLLLDPARYSAATKRADPPGSYRDATGELVIPSGKGMEEAFSTAAMCRRDERAGLGEGPAP